MDIRRQKDTVVAKLRVKGGGLDTVAARLHIERMFGATDFLPAGLPPNAIVCIKRIGDPKPRTLRLSHAASRFSEAWRKAVSGEVERFYQTASRPVREAVPAQAESVVFADQAELLACLAADWCQGKLADNWWWRGLFPNLDRAQTVAKIWLESAEFVPAAFQILAKKGAAIRFVKRLQPHETKDLLRQILRVFGLPQLETVLFYPIEEKAQPITRTSVRSALKKNPVFKPPAAIGRQTRSIFGNLIPEIKPSDLSFERQCLLGIGLLLASSPRIVRSSEFADTLRFYVVQNDLDKTVPVRSFQEVFEPDRELKSNEEAPIKRIPKVWTKNEIQIEQPKSANRKRPFSAEQKGRKIKVDSEKPDFNGEEALKSSDITATEPEELKEDRKHLTKISFEDAQPETSVEKNGREKSQMNEINGAPRDVKSAFQDYFADLETGAEFSFQTRLGGVFYLLNLGLYLQLYSDFTESLTTEIDLNIWDFLALMGHEFLGAQIKTDAVWDFLKTMAERENDGEFGREFNHFQDWRVPPDWLETFPKDQKWFSGKKEKRLVVRHSNGFNVIDVLLRNDFEVQLTNELENYQMFFSGVIKTGSRVFPARKKRRWVKNLAEYLQKRLFQAMDLQTAEELNAILFKRNAAVSMSATHLDITFGLADLPLEVRLAGIDRDPGWIPAAGRFVYFHFV